MNFVLSSRPSLFQRLGGRPALQQLLRHFYADVLQHRELAPIFGAHVKDWPAHLDTIADFWSGVTGGPARYSGAMPWKHVPLRLDERHFVAWLDLWQRQCFSRFPLVEAAELVAAAEAIAQRRRSILAQQAATGRA